MTPSRSSVRVVLRRHAAGDYRTENGQWQIIQPRALDTGAQRRWIIREYEGPGWFALDGDYPTLREARVALEDELWADAVQGSADC